MNNSCALVYALVVLAAFGWALAILILLAHNAREKQLIVWARQLHSNWNAGLIDLGIAWQKWIRGDQKTPFVWTDCQYRKLANRFYDELVLWRKRIE